MRQPGACARVPGFFGPFLPGMPPVRVAPPIR